MPSAKKIQFVPQLINDRFFAVPQFDQDSGEIVSKTKVKESDPKKTKRKGKKDMRYVGYIRISSEDQVGNFSIDAQKRAFKAWIDSKEEGQFAGFYVDEAQSGRTSNRPQFQALRRDAKKNKFDAIVVHKFDRFARNRTEALAIKSLLRHEYGIKVYSVSEPSEDSDGPMGALIEGIMESVADWYSRNLASETKKGKRERAMQGFHNNQAPFGYDKDENGVLVPNEKEAEILREIYRKYVTGDFSDRKLAGFLNDEGFCSKSGKRFATDTVRDILQNRTYLGYVRYQPYQRNADGSRNYKAEIEWFPGKHIGIVDEELFNQCQAVRKAKAVHHEHYPKKRTYLLRGIIYCGHCVDDMPEEEHDDAWGKMRAHSNNGYNLYRCRAKDFGRTCIQSSVSADDIETQVLSVLKTLKPPENWRDRMIASLGDLLGDKSLEERISEIKAIIECMDFRWDQGFVMNKDTFMEERIKLQQQLEELTPIPDDDLEKAANILNNFEQHWKSIAHDKQAQEKLIKMVVARVWVKDDDVMSLSLHPHFHVAIGLESTTSTEVDADRNIVRNRERRGSGTAPYKIIPPLRRHWYPSKFFQGQ